MDDVKERKTATRRFHQDKPRPTVLRDLGDDSTALILARKFINTYCYEPTAEMQIAKLHAMAEILRDDSFDQTMFFSSILALAGSADFQGKTAFKVNMNVLREIIDIIVNHTQYNLEIEETPEEIAAHARIVYVDEARRSAVEKDDLPLTVFLPAKKRKLADANPPQGSNGSTKS